MTWICTRLSTLFGSASGSVTSLTMSYPDQICVSGVSFSVSYNLLACHSDKFNELIDRNKQSEDPICLDGIEPCDFDEVLQCTVQKPKPKPVTDENVQVLVKFAEEFQFPLLKAKCELHLSTWILRSEDWIRRAVRLGVEYRLESLLQLCIPHISVNPDHFLSDCAQKVPSAVYSYIHAISGRKVPRGIPVDKAYCLRCHCCAAEFSRCKKCQAVPICYYFCKFCSIFVCKAHYDVHNSTTCTPLEPSGFYQMLKYRFPPPVRIFNN